MISRRALLAVPFAVACETRGRAGFRGYAFVANEEGRALAAVDLQAMAVARHIPLDGAPTQVIASQTRPLVYALTPSGGSIHEIQADRLNFNRKLGVAPQAVSMRLTHDERALYILAREPRSLVRVSTDSFRVESRILLPEEPSDFALAADGKTAALSLGYGVRLADLGTQQLSDSLGRGDFGAVRFMADGRTLIAANRGDRILSFFDVPSARPIAHLPLAVRPDHLCFSRDDGQLFVTGEGTDAVVIVFPFHTPQVFETVLAGHGLGAMAASSSRLFIASPASGNVSIFDIDAERVIAVVPVGSDPGFIVVTPDDRYALVLNRKSGDLAVLGVESIKANRNRPSSLVTVIPVGSHPVSAAVRGV